VVCRAGGGMSNMEDQMRLFETMTGQGGATAGGQAPPPGPQNRPPPTTLEDILVDLSSCLRLLGIS